MVNIAADPAPATTTAVRIRGPEDGRSDPGLARGPGPVRDVGERGVGRKVPEVHVPSPGNPVDGPVVILHPEREEGWPGEGNMGAH